MFHMQCYATFCLDLLGGKDHKQKKKRFLKKGKKWRQPKSDGGAQILYGINTNSTLLCYTFLR